MARCLHQFYARRTLPTQLFCGFLASLSTAHCYLHNSTFRSICCDRAQDCELPEVTTVGGHKVKISSSSRSLPLSGVTSTQPMFRSNRDDMTKDSKHDSPKFSNLLHAASHPSGEQDSRDTWLSENSSTSETDYDDEHDVEDEEAAVQDPLDLNNADNVCCSPGCRNAARSHGRCQTHGGGTRCNTQGCMKHVVSGGLCVGHGGGRRCRCSPRCTNSAVSRGLCVQHGGGRKCSEQGCSKHVASGGLCRTHGGGRRCQVPYCTSSAQSRGLCYVHGGGGRCQRVGCGSSAKKGGLCIAHGGGHRCQVAGCASSAVSGARCRAHGGGRRCAVDGCTSSAKTGGRCIAHGGGKRCTVNGCTSSAQRLGLCKAHGGGRRCVVENCANSAVSRGRCIAHGGGKRCVFEGCTTTARKGGFCFAHGGRSTTSTANSKSKAISHPSSFPTTPVTVSSKALSWSAAEVRSPIPALTLPPRRLLPPISAMLMANRPSILRRYPYTQIPPIRKPVVSIERGTRRAQNMINEEWQETSKPSEQPTYQYSQYQAPQTSTSSSSRTGYSWQRLQETIRRESRAHGITNDKDEAAYEDTDTCKAEESETPTDGAEVTCSKLNRTQR